ncbi:MAG: hypothetical protein LW655_12355 [Limnohabitans sp.]|nr:hypothetical protein [Limnohabitans sp.]
MHDPLSHTKLGKIVKLLKALFFVAFTFMPGWVFANDSSCESIMDKQQKITCIAIHKKDPKTCNDSPSKDGVHICRAIMGGDSYPCEKVSIGNRPNCLVSVRNVQRKSVWGS